MDEEEEEDEDVASVADIDIIDKEEAVAAVTCAVVKTAADGVVVLVGLVPPILPNEQTDESASDRMTHGIR